MDGGHIVMIIAGGLLLAAWIVCAICYSITRDTDWGGAAAAAFIFCLILTCIGGMTLPDGKMHLKITISRDNAPVLIEHNGILYRCEKFELPEEQE